MNPKPYVGVTGPACIAEVNAIIEEFKDAGYSMDSGHMPMLGFLVSYKTLTGNPTKNRRYPGFKDLTSLLDAAKGSVFTMVHYNSREISSLAGQVSEIFKEIYPSFCKSIQLNIVWPDKDQVKLIKEKFPEMKIVFQASHKAMDGKTPKEISDKIKDYGDTLSYVLIDPSGGKGLEFDMDASINLYSELREKMPRLTIGFAGGLAGNNVAEKITEIKGKTGDFFFCIDAEGGLRDKVTEEYGDDTLNLKKVRNYLQSASLVLS